MKTNHSVFGWEHEPTDERPSEFSQSTGYSVLSGYHVPQDLNARTARRATGSGTGFVTVAVVFVALLALSGWAMHEAVRFLR
jgi:hypothetical protein